jgi:hypothetical protein
MAVLIEGISVVVRRDAIDSKMDGGWERFKLLIPNSTFCHDGEVARVGFLDPAEVGGFIELLNEHGLTYIENDNNEAKPIDMIVVDQQRGPVTDCEWIEFSHLGIDGGKIGAAWFWCAPRIAGAGTYMKPDMTIAMPAGWHFKDSLSDKFEFVPNHLVSQRRDH